MKFYGNGSVWDRERKKVLCRFKDGIHEADERTASILLALGYEHEEIEEPIEEVLTRKEIMQKLDKNKIPYKPNMNKETLLNLLGGE